jgi:hypothetical protein
MKNYWFLFLLVLVVSCGSEPTTTEEELFDFPSREIDVVTGVSIKIVENMKPSQQLSDHAHVQYTDLLNDQFMTVEQLDASSGRGEDPIGRFKDANQINSEEVIEYDGNEILKMEVKVYGTTEPMAFWLCLKTVNKIEYLITIWTSLEGADEFNDKALMMIASLDRV